MCKWPVNDSFIWTLRKRVAATQLTHKSAQPLLSPCREVHIVLEEEDEHKPAPLASKKSFDYAFTRSNLPWTLHIHQTKEWNDTSEQLVAQKAGKLQWYELFFDDVTGITLGAEYNGQTTLPRIPVIVMESVKPIAVHYVVFVNPFAMNAVETAQIHSWWYEEITRILPALEKLRTSTWLHFGGKWIISTIGFITDIVHQTLAKIACSCGAMVYSCKTSINSIYGFRT